MRIPRFVAAASGAAVALALVLTGCGGTVGEVDTAEIVTVNGVEPQHPLIPANNTEPGALRILDAIFAGLVSYDETGAVVNDLAESIEASEGNKIFTIRLGSSTFTDGTDVTASSFAEAWNWAALASTESPNRGSFADIVGYNADEDASLIEGGGLVVVDQRTLEVHLAAAHPDFPLRLGLPEFFPLPASFFDDPAAFGADPIGNGPYMFDGDDAWKHGKRLELAVNPDYEGPRTPENVGLTMRFYDSLDVAYVDLLSGFLDVLDTLPESAYPTYKDELGRNTIDQPIAELELLILPARLAHLSKAEGALRRAAISMSIDRASITADVFGGTRIPAHDFTSPALDSYADNLSNAELLDFNDDEAKLRWAEAEELKPWEGPFQIAYNADGGHQEWAERVAASISSVLGIEAVAVPYSTVDELIATIQDGSIESAYRQSWTADYPGVYDSIARYGSKNALNFGKYVSKDFDSLLKSGSAAPTLADATATYQRAQQILLAELPAIPLWNDTVRAGYSEKVDDVALDWRGMPLYFQITKDAD